MSCNIESLDDGERENSDSDFVEEVSEEDKGKTKDDD